MLPVECFDCGGLRLLHKFHLLRVTLVISFAARISDLRPQSPRRLRALGALFHCRPLARKVFYVLCAQTGGFGASLKKCGELRETLRRTDALIVDHHSGRASCQGLMRVRLMRAHENGRMDRFDWLRVQTQSIKGWLSQCVFRDTILDIRGV